MTMIDNKNIEMINLVGGCNDLEQGTNNHQPIEQATTGKITTKTKQLKGLIDIESHLQLLNEHWNIKMLCRKWRPRLEFVVRLMLVSTFFDDSFRTLIHFSDLKKQIVEQGGLSRWETVVSSPSFASPIATILLGIGLVAQSMGSICLLALFQPDGATKVLIGWSIVQPILYGQISNAEFVAESLSLIGGMLMLRAHLILHQAKFDVGARLQLMGRLLLPSMYLYYAGQFLFSAFTLDETSDLSMYISSLSKFALSLAALVSLVISSMLVTVGLQSRLFALFLALFNIGFVFYHHFFFQYIYREGGEWKMKDTIYLTNSQTSVSLPEDITLGDFDKWEIYDLHRYNFFLGISTSGAFLLLTLFGPGEIAVQKNEIILSIRAQD